MSKIKVTGIAAGEDGSIAATPTILVDDSGGHSTSTIYENMDGDPKNNPFSGDSNGLFEFYADPGVYRITVSKRNRSRFRQDYVAVGNIPYDARQLQLLHFSQNVGTYTDINITNSPYAIQSWSTLGWSDTSPPISNLGGGDIVRCDGDKFESAVSISNGLSQASLPAAWDQSACAIKWEGVGKRTFQVEAYVRPVGTIFKAQPGSSSIRHYLGLMVVDTADFEAGTWTPTGWNELNVYGPYPNTHEALDDLPQELIMEFVPLRPGETVVMMLGISNVTNGTQIPLANVSMLVHP